MLTYRAERTVGALPQRRTASLALRMSPDATIEETSPPWIREVNRRLEHLRTLKQNWDGENAPPVSFECCIEALVFLLENAANETPAPQIVPTSKGGLQLEWHVGEVDLEIEFSASESTSFYHVSESGEETVGKIAAEGQRVRNILRALPVRDGRKQSTR